VRRGWVTLVTLVLGFLFGAVTMAGWQQKWEAATALATLAAVIVALVPIWQGEGRIRQQARVFRVRLIESLMPLAVLLREHAGTVPQIVRFDDNLRAQMRLFRSLLPKATHLDADEFDHLLAVYDALAVASHGRHARRPSAASVSRVGVQHVPLGMRREPGEIAGVVSPELHIGGHGGPARASTARGSSSTAPRARRTPSPVSRCG